MSKAATLRKATHVRTVTKSYFWREALREHGAKHGLKSTDLAVLLMLETYSRDDGSNAHPGKERLSANLGVSESTVQRGLDNGRKSGWIFCTQRGNHRLGRANVWRMCIPNSVPPSKGEMAAGLGQVFLAAEGQQAKRHGRVRSSGTSLASSSTDDTPSTQASGGSSLQPTDAELKAMHEQMLRDEGYEDR